MRHILKAIEGEQQGNSIQWDLTIYDDETNKIEEISEFQYAEESKW